MNTDGQRDAPRGSRTHGDGDDDPPRTVVFGFDAMDFRYLDRFADSLEHLPALREAGVEAPLRSTHPPWTASAWPSMYTGTGPDHHGVFGFFDYDYPDDARLVDRNDADAPALWNYLSAEGVTSVVLNVPVTHPAEPIEGALVPGYLAPDDAPGHPSGVREELSAALGEPYRIYSRGELADDPDEKLAGYLELIDQRGRAAVELLAGTDWEVAVLQVQKTDAVFHNFDDPAVHRRVYEAADAFVGRVLAAVDGPVNVVVCSDHGMGEKRGYRIFLNEVLRRRGYLTATSGSAPALSDEKAALVAGGGDGADGGSGVDEGDPRSADGGTDVPPGGDGSDARTAEGETDARTAGEGTDTRTADDRADGRALSTRLLEGGIDAASRVGLTPGTVYAAAERVGLGSTLVDLAPERVRRAARSTVDWRASRAYCRGGARLGVRINLAGREPDGVVAPEEYESLRDELVADLSSLSTPDGRPAFDRVVRREAVFDGPHADAAPDVLVVPRDMDNLLSARIYGREFLPIEKYDHEFEGVFLASGPSVDEEWTAEELSLTDVTPVALALAGLPVPERTTGRVPPGLLSVPVERAAYPDVAFGTRDGGGRPAEGAEVTERLRDLGYL